MLSENSSVVVDGMCTIKNQNRGQDDVAHSGSIAVFPASFGNMFVMNASTLERYIPNAILDSHLSGV